MEFSGLNGEWNLWILPITQETTFGHAKVPQPVNYLPFYYNLMCATVLYRDRGIIKRDRGISIELVNRHEIFGNQWGVDHIIEANRNIPMKIKRVTVVCDRQGDTINHSNT